VTEPDEVPVRDAATVILLRDGTGGVEAWLLTRAPEMVFAAGMSVYPGGRVEAGDADVPVAISAEDLRQVADRFGCAPEAARALLAAAIRETYEETGVLLSTPSADLPDARADVEAGRTSFADLLREHALAADGTALRPWARWVTPVGEVRRYDTRFFVAALPAEARAQSVTSEASVADWIPARQALAELAAGERAMLPPTQLTLQAVLDCGTVADVLTAAADRDLTAVRPTLHRAADNSHYITLPDGTTAGLPTGRRS
jgi:8-oxo-dGTP pyrophosphatase MutT (NUDIX family)